MGAKAALFILAWSGLAVQSSGAASAFVVQVRCNFMDLDVNGICSGNRFPLSLREFMRQQVRELCIGRPDRNLATLTINLDLSLNVTVEVEGDEAGPGWLQLEGLFDVDLLAAAFCKRRGDSSTQCPAAAARGGRMAYAATPPIGMELMQRDGAFSWEGRRLAKHISFFFSEARLLFINRMLKEADTYPMATDIFIHVNHRFARSRLRPYANGRVDIVVHQLNGTHKFEMRRACRPLMAEQLEKKSPGPEGVEPYAAFMFVEDDILVYKDTLEYWMEYHRGLLAHNFNLGFIRIEYDESMDGGRKYISDFDGTHNGRLEQTLSLNGTKYIVNRVNTYTASWIYNRNEFARFVASKYWDPDEVEGSYGYGESQGVALHGLYTPWYKGTLIPLVAGNRLHPHCEVHHMANSYLNYQVSRTCENEDVCGGEKIELATIPFDEAVNSSVLLDLGCADCHDPKYYALWDGMSPP